jgi:uncharacterized protein
MLVERLKKEYMTAMKEKNANAKEAISDVRGAIQYAETKKGRKKDIDDAEIINIIKKCVKECKESIDAFGKAEGYEEQVNSYSAKLKVFESYLPNSASEEQTKDAVDRAISAVSATTMKEMGMVMKEARNIISSLDLDVDGKLLSEIVKSKLG